jgi:hypothetical protein
METGYYELNLGRYGVLEDWDWDHIDFVGLAYIQGKWKRCKKEFLRRSPVSSSQVIGRKS